MTYGRTDKNHAEIRDGLRKLGIVVFDAFNVKGGFPDLVVGYGGATYLIEIKSGKGVLNKKQVSFHKRWKGIGAIATCWTLEEVLEVINWRIR